MWIYFSNSSKQICIFQCHLDHLFEASQRVHQSCRDSTKDNVKEFKDVKLLKSGHKPGPLHDLAFFILFLLYWAWNADTATVRESETEVMKDQLHFMYAQKIPKTQKPTQDTKFRAIHFICLGTRPPKKEGNTFKKRWKCSEANPIMSHVLYGFYDSLNTCKKRQVVILNQPFLYPRRPEKEEHLKIVDALIGIVFCYSPLLTAMPHSAPTTENNV